MNLNEVLGVYPTREYTFHLLDRTTIRARLDSIVVDEQKRPVSLRATHTPTGDEVVIPWTSIALLQGSASL